MYYKILSNQELLDVIVNPTYVRRGSNGALKQASPSQAEGVCSSNGNTVWNILGRTPIYPQEDFVQVIEISSSEYLALKEGFDIKEKIEQTQTESKSFSVDEMSLNFIREQKIRLMSSECSKAITDGFFVNLTDNKIHYFEMTLEDQINLLSIQEMIKGGVTEIPYHEKGQPCVMFSVDDVLLILKQANWHRLYHTTYFNNLKSYINTLEDMDLIYRLHYGAEIPKEYQTEALKSLLK